MKTELLSLCIICKDDEVNISRLITKARKHVDEIVCVDTGSTDNSAKAAKDAGADVVKLAPELLDVDGFLCNFSEARQLSYSLASLPWQLWLDSDDDLTNWDELRPMTATADRMRSAGYLGLSVSLWYDYSWTNDRSRCTQSFTRERLTCRHDNWVWRRPVHEFLWSDTKLDSYLNENTRVIHMSQGARGITNDRNLRILKHWKTNNPNEESAVLYYYLGDEMLARNQFSEAFDFFKEAASFIDLKGSAWQIRSIFRAGRTLMLAGRYKDTIDYFSKTLKNIPDDVGADCYWELARALISVGENTCAAKVMESAVNKKPISGEDPELFHIVTKALNVVV